MPTRSLNSPVLKWPDHAAVHNALTAWARGVVQHRPDILRLGYVGSYARGDYGVGSDLDIILVVEAEAAPFVARSQAWDTCDLPVPTDLQVYTRTEWNAIQPDSRWGRILRTEAHWIYPSPAIHLSNGHHMLTDTSSEAEQVQLALLRQAGCDRCIAGTLSLSESVIHLARQAIQKVHPDWSEQNVRLEFAAVHYGRDVANRVRAALEK